MASKNSQQEKQEKFETPSIEAFKSKQIDLFQSFLCNHEEQREKLSNAFDYWDTIPRYSVSRKAMTQMRSNEGTLPILRIPFHCWGRSLTAVIRPARIENSDGSVMEYYPSANEELVEDALRKIAADQRCGFYQPDNQRGGVVFSLHQLRQELARRSHTRSYQQLMLSLDILSFANIDIRSEQNKEVKGFMRSNYFAGLSAVTRESLADDPNAKWVVFFHPLATQAIDALAYRQFNYARMMSHSTQLGRWLHKQLVLKFTFASMTHTFEMRYSTIRRDSALLEGYARERDAIKAMDTALDELIAKDILVMIDREFVKGIRGKIEDVLYTLTASKEFVSEVKTSNKRKSNLLDHRS